jgi:ATP-binding protein involved in chromosome partitioning
MADDAAPSPLPPLPANGSAPPTAEAVRGALGGVLDPELGLPITELGMVRDVAVAPDGVVRIGIALTTAACPLRTQIGADATSRVASLPGVTDVTVDYAEMTADQRAELMARARREAQRRAPSTRVAPTTRVLAVASGKGGVGKSSVTVNLAVALALRGFTVGVLDADIWGFSVPRLLGIAARLRARKTDDGKGLIQPEDVEVGTGKLRVVSMGLLLDDEDTALMWRGLILSKALEQFLTDVEWDDLDYLLIDMPPGTGDIQMALARLLPQAELLVVTTPATNAQKVAARVADMARRSHLAVLGIVENMTAFVAPDGSRHEIFGAGGGRRLSALTGAPLIAQVPIEPAVATNGDDGRPVVTGAPDTAAAGAFSELARAVAEELLPPVEMSSCTARIADLVAKAGANSSPA